MQTSTFPQTKTFLAALGHYRTTYATATLRTLEGESDVRAAVRALLTERVRVAVEGGGRGCLLINAATERLPQDQPTGRIVRDVLTANQEAPATLLRAAAERGELSSRHGPETLAAFLVTFLNGLLVASKVTPDARALESLVEVALGTLE
ncbi:TetR family transcriptional regulator C-terminal domain-containing protein [Nonomuraea sp. NPDC049421]|uniref:TetR family transcriptional regulator C-terminal domain-containing protein n=1 Tax=Nonomuraea sp. NPDC049421 TaxID=3155275 RepID=UPI003439D66C